MTNFKPDPKADLLPLIGRTMDVGAQLSDDHWRSVFGELWGSIDLKAVKDGQISGSLHSRKVGNLTFSRIEFGNQKFERTHAHLKDEPEPFYSLTFPESGAAECQIGDTYARLAPEKAYLLNNGLAAKLKIDEKYSTFNVKIPLSDLEHRLGRKTDILSRAIVQPDAIYHMMNRLIVELLENVDVLDERAGNFMASQMLDTVAFFLMSGGTTSEDSIAVQAIRARVIAYLDARFRDTSLTPQKIAAACGISRSYLYRVFAKDEPVMERLRRRRLEAARGMIENNPANQSLTQIAMSCGISSSAEFSRQFKTEFGVSPSKL